MGGVWRRVEMVANFKTIFCKFNALLLLIVAFLYRRKVAWFTKDKSWKKQEGFGFGKHFASKAQPEWEYDLTPPVCGSQPPLYVSVFCFVFVINFCLSSSSVFFPECLMISSPSPSLILLAVHFLIKFGKRTKTTAFGLF